MSAYDDCGRIFDEAVKTRGPFWHLCTPGKNQQVIFTTIEDFEFGMLILALCAFANPKVRIITFELMGNHLHIVLQGDQEDCEQFFNCFKKRLQKYLKAKKSGVSLLTFKSNLISIDTLESLRAHIIYVNRNNYLVDPNQTPCSYPYGANSFYFSELHKQNHRCRFGDLSIKDKRALTRSHEWCCPEDTLMIGNYISPVSYCDIAFGESMFRDARHYFNQVSRNIEQYNGIASIIGDGQSCTYDELISAAYAICQRKYDGLKPNLLSPPRKIELARALHYDYRASNKTISKILNLDIKALNEMFGTR